MYTHLGNEDETKRSSGAEDNKDWDDDEGRCLLLAEDEADRYTQHTHDGHVVDGHAHIFGVVQSGDLNLSRLPGKKCTKELKKCVAEM